MRYLILFFAFFVSLFSNAQELEKSLLWKISGNGLKQPSYLYGTIHMTCDATLDENTLNALETTKQLYLELDMDEKSMQIQMNDEIYDDEGWCKIIDLIKSRRFQHCG